MAKAKGIFKSLEREGLTYSVVSSVQRFKVGGHSNNEYFLVASIKEKTKFAKFGFYEYGNHSEVVERDLRKEEITNFRDLMQEGYFKEVISNSDGRVYELSSNSLKELIESTK